MDRIDQFLENKCIKEEGQKVPSSILFNEFIIYLKEVNDKNAYLVNNRTFTQTLKTKYPQYPLKKESQHNVFLNITIPSEYLAPKPKRGPLEYKKWRQQYNHNYYLENKDQINDQRRRNYRLMCSYDEELMGRLGIDKKRFFNRRKYGLIIYIFNEDKTVNWSETLKKCEELATKFLEQQKKERETRKDKELHLLKKEYECSKHNLDNWTKINPDHPDIKTLKSLVIKREKEIIKLHNNQVSLSDFGTFTDEPAININNITDEEYYQYQTWYNEETERLEKLRIDKYDNEEVEVILEKAINLLSYKMSLVEEARPDLTYQ